MSRSLFVEGYVSPLGCQSGDEVGIHVSTSASRFSVEIAREGADRRVVWSKSDLPGHEHPVPKNASSHGCRWPAALKLPVSGDWPSGYYSVRLRVADRGGEFVQRNRRTAEGWAFFVVRPQQPGKNARILLQLSTNTYNAYTNWGGYSLYSYNGRGKVQGRRVSFLRPLSSQFETWEKPFVVWAEKSGFPVDYAVNLDLELQPQLLRHYPLVLSVGHDEYWSSPMRDQLEAYIANGGNVAFFSGNTCCWQVRAEENGNALVSYKQAFRQDPLYGSGHPELLSTLWSHHLVGRPENRLTGVGFLWGGYHRSHEQFMDGSGAYAVHRPNHWIFANTGLKRGDGFGGKDTIVGYECDGCEHTWIDGDPVPTYRDGTPRSFQILASAPAKWHPDDCEWYERWQKGRVGRACLGIYQQGGTVFTSGSTDWAHGLRGGDPIVERITRNVLERLSCAK